jgi:autotransporter-associated beta strand protein
MISLGRVSRSVTTAAILFNAIFGANAAVAQLLTPSLTGQVETGGQYYYLEVYGPDQTYEYVRQRINPGEPVNGFSSSAAWNNQILSYSLGLAAFPMFGFGVKIPWSDQAFGTIYNVSYCLTGTGDLCTTREQNSLPTGLNLGWAYVQNAYPIIESGNVASGSGINKTSNLGQVLVPAFKGGTLVVDQTNQANNSNFSVDGSTTNTIDANGNNFTFAGVFSDELIGTRGSLRVVSSSPNSGFITFSGANTYTGLTTVSSGELSVMGSLQSDTSILPGGILSGSGVVNADVTNAGIVAPGRQGTRGTFTINGDYTQTSSGTLDLDVGGNGESDLLQINNGKVADLAGTVKISSLPGTSITPGIVYTGIATNPGVAYSGGSTAQSDTSSVVGASGYIFLREDDPGFQKLNNGTALVDSTKLQFGWLQLQPDAVKQPSDKKPPGTINPAATTPGQQSINQVKQKVERSQKQSPITPR